MWRLGIVTSAVAALTFAQTFTFTIGSPVASLDGRSKLAAFVFRTEGCADATKAQIDGTAEGLIQGAAAHYGEEATIAQAECMLRGAGRCVLSISFRGLEPRTGG